LSGFEPGLLQVRIGINSDAMPTDQIQQLCIGVLYLIEATNIEVGTLPPCQNITPEVTTNEVVFPILRKAYL